MQKIAIWALPLIFAITVHEVAHGVVALWCGDKTAKNAGRLTLNPIPHIDFLGTIVLPVILLMTSNFIFGWAKPVPVDQRALHNPRFDMALVAAAGPISNILMAFMWGAVAKLGVILVAQGNGFVGLPLGYMGDAGIMINIVLAILNLIPLPPLDGGNMLKNLLPRPLAYPLMLIEPYSFFILVLLLLTGLISSIMQGPVMYMLHLIQNIYGL